MQDPHRIEAAAGRFRAFFDELSETFLEREDVLRQIGLALLSRQHCLLSGPPGTAKSALATAVFGRIICQETGSPSMYQRQITESTVQTDLIGPIDFKNLMETGRTTHFTDEGMLGAAHAFLDEVFDGRDMLLRSALNVLQERELKQGSKLVRGDIEVALMTSNRYIADVLEQARETLLAFVDRVAFVGFVPRGFADQKNMTEVLNRHVAKARSSKLDALLTIQDVDVLQDLTDSVVVSQPICKALAELLAGLDVELNAAVRADPTFVPTRYLSTRTAVRSGQVLRAICAHDRIFHNPTRELQVLPDDLASLRLHLLLAGPSQQEVQTLLDRETDPNERRQLEIVRTEREIFERCLSKVGKVRVPKLPKKKAAKSAKPNKKDKKQKKKASQPSRFAAIEAAIGTRDVKKILGAIAEASRLALNDEEAEPWMERAVAALRDAAVRAALDSNMSQSSLTLAAEQLVDLATTIDDDTVSKHGVSKWLRSRAVAMIDEAARYATGARAEDLLADVSVEHVKHRLDALDHLGQLRHRAVGAEVEDDASWLEAVDHAEDGIAAIWDGAFCRAAEGLLKDAPNAPLSDLLSAIQHELQWLDDIDQRLRVIRGGPSTIKAKAIGVRLSDLVASVMRRLDKIDRGSLHEEIEQVMAMLAKAQLANTIEPSDWMLWSAEALARNAGEVPAPSAEHSYDAYVALRENEQRTPIAYTLGEVALRVDDSYHRKADDVSLEAVAGLMRNLPEDLRHDAAEVDLSRIERAVSYLETWWDKLCAGDKSATERLDDVVRSRIFKIIWDDAALARFALEAKLIGEIIPASQDRAQALKARLEKLERVSRRGAHALLRERTDEAWDAAQTGAVIAR